MQYRFHCLGHFRKSEFLISCRVQNSTSRYIKVQNVSFVNERSIEDYGREADVDCIPVENSGKGLCNNRSNANHLDNKWGLLPAGAHSKIIPGNDKISLLYP